MTTSPTSVNEAFAMVEGFSPNVAGINSVRLAVRIGSSTVPVASDADVNYASATKQPASTNLTIAWALSGSTTKVSAGSVVTSAGVYLFADDQDGAGTGAGRLVYVNLATGVTVACPTTGFAVATSGTATIPLANLADCGSYKVVAVLYNITGAPPAEPSTANVEASATNTEFYIDADGNLASSGATLPALIARQTGRTGWFRIGAKVQSLTFARTANGGTSTAAKLGYPNTFTISGDIHNAAVKNPKVLHVGIVASSAANSGAPVKDNTATPASADGTFGPISDDSPAGAFRVDSLFPTALTNHRFRIWTGATGGFSVTKPDCIASHTPSGGFSADQNWVYFDTVAAGLAKVGSSDFCLESTTDQSVSSAILIDQDSSGTTPGVGPFSSSGYSTAQDIFKRTGSVNTTNAVPFLQAFVFDGHGNKLDTVAVSATVRRSSDDGIDNTQALSTGTGGTLGRLRWNYTIGAADAAFSRYIKAGTTRVTGSHVATGPDTAGTPAPVFSATGPSGRYTGPFEAYPRKVRITGAAFSGTNEPQDNDTSVFGINSEILFEDCWTGILADAAEDGNGCPTGPGKREQTLGAGSLKAKLATLINEGTVKVITPANANPVDVAGRAIDLSGAEVLQGRRALHDVTNGVVSDAGTNLSNSFNLDTPLGYATGTSSYDSIAAPSDPGSLLYYQAYKDSNNGNEAAEDAAGFLISGTGSVPAAGAQTDSGNRGHFAQPVSFVAADLSISLLLDIDRTQTGPGVTRHFVIKVIRVTPDDTIVGVTPDSAPLYVVAGQPTSGPMVLISQGLASAVAGGDGSDWEFSIATPSGYDSVKVMAFAKVQGSRTPGGGESQVQIGWDFDAVDFAAGIPFR